MAIDMSHSGSIGVAKSLRLMAVAGPEDEPEW